MNEAYLAKALKLLDRLHERCDQFALAGRDYFITHGEYSPAYSFQLRRYFAIKKALNAKLTYFFIDYDDKYEHKHCLLQRPNGV
jgi:hypothetical protein